MDDGGREGADLHTHTHSTHKAKVFRIMFTKKKRGKKLLTDKKKNLLGHPPFIYFICLFIFSEIIILHKKIKMFLTSSLVPSSSLS